MRQNLSQRGRRRVGAGTGLPGQIFMFFHNNCENSEALDSHGGCFESLSRSLVCSCVEPVRRRQKVWKPLCKCFLREAESHPPPVLMGTPQRDRGPAAGRQRLLLSPDCQIRPSPPPHYNDQLCCFQELRVLLRVCPSPFRRCART